MDKSYADASWKLYKKNNILEVVIFLSCFSFSLNLFILMLNSEDKSIFFWSKLKIEVKNTSIYTFSTFLTGIGSFLIVPLFWKKLTPADYGVIAITDIAGSIIVMFVGLSLDTSITRFYYDWEENKRKRQIGSIWMMSWISHIVLGIPLIYIISLASPILFPEVTFYPFIFLGLLSQIFVCLTVVPLATIRIKKLPVIYSIYSLAIFTSRMALNIYLVLIINKGLYGYFIGNIIAGIFNVIVGSLIMLKFATPCFPRMEIKESLKFSLPMIPAKIISTTSVYLDKFILQQFASLEVLGIYAISSKFANLVLLLHSALKLSFVPFMVEAVSKGRNRGACDVARMSLFYLLPILTLGIMMSVYIREFVIFANRLEYFPIVKWVPWLIGPAIISTFYIYFTPGLFLSKKTDKLWIPRIIQLLAVLISGLLLIPKYELKGIVITQYISALFFFGVSFVLSDKYYPIPFNWKKIILLFFVTIVCIYISSLLELNSFTTNILTKAFLIILTCSVCLGILMDFRVANYKK